MSRRRDASLDAAYRAALGELYALERQRGIDLRLDRVRAVLRLLGDPQRRFRAFHVAGTNGKGSVAALIHAALTRAGYRASLYTSPHLEDYRERIVTGNRRIGRREILESLGEIRSAAVAAGVSLTFFETTTVLAFLHFARRGVEAAAVEVGLGGRLDATNVVEPAVAVITSIGHDHMDRLGSTLAEIAAEKAGIIKGQAPVIAGRLPVEAMAVVREATDVCGAPLLVLGEDFSLEPDAGGFQFRSGGFELKGIQMALAGRFQQDNVAVALAALRAASGSIPVPQAAMREAVAQVSWPGRLEILGGRPPVILDGAHNPEAARALAAEIPALAGARPVHLVFAVMRDKDWRPMLDALAPQCASVVVTEVMPRRAEPARGIVAHLTDRVPAVAVADPAAAFRAALKQAEPDGLVLVAGSLFLVGAVRPMARRHARRTQGVARAQSPSRLSFPATPLPKNFGGALKV